MSDNVTFKDFFAQCKVNSSEIYVRAKIDGKWQSVKFGSLSSEQQLATVKKWYAEGRQNQQ